MALHRNDKVVAAEWERVKELFETVLEYSPHERESFLSQFAQEEPLIAEQVAMLVCSYGKAGNFLEQSFVLEADFLETLEADQRFSPGDILCGRFCVVRLIGKGGMGEVYEAWDQELEELVALKTLRSEVSANEIFTARFRREVQLARKITHPNVCRIFDSFRHQAGNEAPLAILSMEFLPGQTLAEYLKTKGRLSAGEALPLAHQIIDGLRAVHAAGIIHRDVKPSNFILIPDGSGYRVKITDFGIAGRLRENPSQPSLTQAGRILGTPDYMAPEQLENGRATIQSDIYSLGLVLYEMVIGAKPFAENGASERLYQMPRPPRKLVADLPRQWNDTILCCLERKPEFRFPAVASVAESLAPDAPLSLIPRKPFTIRLKAAIRLRTRLIAAVALLCVALLVPALRYFRQSPEIPKGTTVLVTDIVTSDPDLSGITVALKSQLQQSVHFDIEDDSKIMETLKQMNRKSGESMDIRTAREVAWRSGVPLVISGMLTSDRNNYLLTMKVERIKHTPLFPALVWRKDFTAKDKADLLDAVHDASSWIRTLVGEAAGEFAQQDRPVEDTSTGSWQALQLFTEAEKKYSSGDTTAAVIIVREAIQADPEFVKAHMRLADILVGNREYNEGYSEWRKAMSLADKKQLTSRESLRLQGQYYEDVGDYPAAEAKFHEYTIHYPNDYLAWIYWGSVLNGLDRNLDALEAFQQAVRLHPDYFGSHAHLAMTNLALERYSDAEVNITTMRSLGETDWSIWLGSISAFLQGNYDNAFKLMQILQSSRHDDWKSKSYLYMADFLAELGRFDEAISNLELGITFDRSHSRSIDQADKLIALGHLFLQRQSPVHASEYALAALELDKNPVRLLEAGTILARAGHINSVLTCLRQLNNYPETSLVNFVRHRLWGELALVRQELDKAVEQFQAAAGLAAPREEKEYLANVFFSAHDYAHARLNYKFITERPARWLMYGSSDWPGLWAMSVLKYVDTTPPPDTYSCDLARRFSRIQNTSAHAGLQKLLRQCK